MANDNTASIIPLHQPARPRTPAERARAYRARKRQGVLLAAGKREATVSRSASPQMPACDPGVVKTSGGRASARLTPVTKPVTSRVTPSRSLASILLVVASLALAAVGITMNGWFARSLGSSNIAGWLFLAIGVAADIAALAVPSSAALLWERGRRATAAAGWAIWFLTFAFALTAGIGFASVNIADVTLERASRVTPAVTVSQVALVDATAARDRECAGGVGKNCRIREEAVAERRRALETAMRTVEQSADPQTQAAAKIVAWASAGTVQPSDNDFAMLRLILLALLPQVGGVLLMVARPK